MKMKHEFSNVVYVLIRRNKLTSRALKLQEHLFRNSVRDVFPNFPH